MPNAAFILAEPTHILSRIITPFLLLFAAMLAMRLPKTINYFVFLAVAIIDIILIVAIAFHLPIKTVIASTQYLFEIDAMNSALYVGGTALIISGALFSAFLINKNRERLRGFSPILPVLLTFWLCVLGIKYDLEHLAGYDGPIDSAVMQTGFENPTTTGSQKNLLIVMVEGMGSYKDPAHREILQNYLAKDLDTSRYDLSNGQSHYFGSTTGAESRELCGQWGDFQLYMDDQDYDCLPRRYTEAGYKTTAYHGFTQDMFDRDVWIPNIGFEELNYMEQLEANHADQLPGRCGSVFVGFCDTELANVVKAELTRESNQPKLVYWLTVNSHVPFEAIQNGPLNCGKPSAEIHPKDVCQLTEMWGQIMESTSDIANTPGLQPTDILIIGDHHTPMFKRKSKLSFEQHKVDWFLLRDQRPPIDRRLAKLSHEAGN